MIRILMVLAASLLAAQSYLTTQFDTSIKSPKAFFGYAIGDYYTEHHDVIRYMQYLDSISGDRSQLITYGSTYQRRELVLLIISDASNMTNIDQRIADNAALTNGSAPKSGQVPFVYLSYNVHGNETSSSEAAMVTAYHLLAGQDAETQSFMKNGVMIIDPMMNPDGRQRYITWFQNRVGMNANADMNSVEHDEPWPGGRTNHYMFDLNRDWAFASQKETRHRLKVYHRFKPQVFVDFHEMGSNASYFFFPATKPFNPYYPTQIKKWGVKFGAGNAAEMDKHGRLYYTAEIFDLFYPGYGDSYPSLHGAIGMTYEQSGHSRGGKIATRDDGSVLTLRERAFNHYRTSIATIRTAINGRQELLTDFADFYKKSLQAARNSGIRYFVLDRSAYSADLADALAQHQIDMEYVSRRQQIRSGRQRLTIEAGQVVIPAHQSQYFLIRTLLDDQVAVPDTAFYDISSWSMPRAFNVQVYRTSDRITISKNPPETTPVTFTSSSYGYIFTPNHYRSYGFLHALQSKGIRVRVSSYEIQTAGKTFAPGSIIIVNSRNSRITNLNEILKELVETHHVELTPLSSGLSRSGKDIGSDSNSPIPRIHIAIVTDDPMYSNSVGALWFLFDQKVKQQVSLIPTESLGRTNLDRYSTIIIGNVWSSGRQLQSKLGDGGITHLKNWVQGGGHLIGVAGGAGFLTQNRSKLSSNGFPKSESDNDSETVMNLPYKDRPAYFSKQSFPGAFMETTMDLSHPLAVGIQHPFYVLKTNRIAIERTDRVQHVGWFKPGQILGYAPSSVSKSMKNSAFMTYERSGSGAITTINADPVYRMFTYGTAQLLLNAVYLGNARF